MAQYELGKLMNLDEITIDDQKKNKIWVNDLSGEDEDDFDETSMRPLLNENTITKEIVNGKTFLEVSILVQIKDTEIYGSAHIDENGNLNTIMMWQDDSWQEIENIVSKNEKIYIKNLVPIFGESDNTYEYVYGKDVANKI